MKKKDRKNTETQRGQSAALPACSLAHLAVGLARSARCPCACAQVQCSALQRCAVRPGPYPWQCPPPAQTRAARAVSQCAVPVVEAARQPANRHAGPTNKRARLASFLIFFSQPRHLALLAATSNTQREREREGRPKISLVPTANSYSTRRASQAQLAPPTQQRNTTRSHATRHASVPLRSEQRARERRSNLCMYVGWSD